MSRLVAVEKLAPTGEGIARTDEGVGFVRGALPGEEVEVEVLERHASFWRGRTVAVRIASPHRRPSAAHDCGGCDWAHFDPAAAREAKRGLFLETMERIGKLPRAIFGELPVVPSPSGYRIRSRFHVSGREEALAIGFFQPRTHRVEPVESCEMVTPETLAMLPRLRAAIAGSGARVSEVATLETLDGGRRIARIRLEEESSSDRRAALANLGGPLAEIFAGFRIERPDGRTLLRVGEPRLSLEVEGRSYRVGVDTFFQSNRYLLGALAADVRGQARDVPPGPALDAYAGVGLFAGALLDAGHAVTSAESDPASCRDADATRAGWADAVRWRYEPISVETLLGRAAEYALSVADPPRAGLAGVARRLGEKTRSRLVYVSCDPTTLARDLAILLDSGFSLCRARLYDLFAFTHRIEAIVTLDRDDG